MRITSDDRGQSYWDLFPELEGQINVSITLPKQRRGFHLHKEKIDNWVVIAGPILLVTKTLSGKFEAEYKKTGDYIQIPTNIWHAYQALDTPAVVAYYETKKSGAERFDDYEMNLDRYKGWK